MKTPSPHDETGGECPSEPSSRTGRLVWTTVVPGVRRTSGGTSTGSHPTSGSRKSWRRLHRWPSSGPAVYTYSETNRRVVRGPDGVA